MKKELKVLVIDDMLFMREMISDSIRKAFPKADVDVAGKGKDAQSKIESVPYDLILCDWELPDIKGNELLQWAKSHETTAIRDIPFIMVTARSDKDAIMEAKKGGVADYIIKPLTLDVLSKKVAAALSQTKEGS